MPITPGARLGTYEIVSVLGTGGMGEVYRAHDSRLGRQVAIKTVRATSPGSEGHARLWREARAAASVNHPGICQVYDVGELDDTFFIVMELLDGESVSQRTTDGPLPLDDAVQAAIGVLSALEALHRVGIVHRDLKPSNVFLTPNGVKLLDFGLARTSVGGADLDVTRTGIIVGTPRYMAPEQFSANPPDPRTDLFATALLLFEMLTGRPAFEGNDLAALYNAILSEQPPALSGSQRIVAVDGVIHRALEKRLEDRYPNAEAMAHALRSAMMVGQSSGAVALPVRATRRLIVFPFRLVRPDPDLDFLPFSLPDAVTASLAGLESLVVRSTLAGAKYPLDNLDLKTIASELSVDAVLFGTLLRAGNQVRLTAQLVEAPSGTVLWSHTAQQPVGDILELQNQLVRGIVDSLAIPLSSHETLRLRRDLPACAAAYEYYLRANQISQDTTQLSIALELYRSAISEDPRFAPAWARIGRVYRVLAKFGDRETSHANLAQADQAFRRALELNPDLPVAHNLYTNFEVESGRAVHAMSRLVQRVQSHTADPELFVGLVLACRYCGLLEASLAADRHARRLDPSIRTSVMYTHFMLGDWERAIATDTDLLRWVSTWALPLLGRTSEAIEILALQESRALPPVMHRMTQAARAALEQKPDVCRQILASFDQKERFDPEGLYFIARLLLHIKETGPALEVLGDAVDEGFFCPQALVRDPWFDPIRTDSRFGDIVRRAEERSREAEAEFRRLGGIRLLGLEASTN